LDDIQEEKEKEKDPDIKIEQLSLIEQLEKQKQEIELKMKEETKRQEEEKRQKEKEEKEEEETKRQKDDKKKKQSNPKNVRVIIWNHYIGEDIIKHKCLCCKKVTISNTNFDVGHVLSEKNGGTHEINNLRPICFACNHSMGSENMIDFVVKFGLFIG
jgi:5-methylcytosine-specific restriction endonuclease McrA